MATKKSKPEAAAKKPGNTFLKKMTVKEMGLTPELKKIPDDETVPLCRIAGYAQGTKEGESTYGEWRALMGDFVGVNLVTGETFSSPVAIIPSAIGEMLFQQTVRELHEDASARVQFAVQIGVRISTRDKNKYEYVVQPLIEAGTENPAMKLLQLRPDSAP